MHLVQRLENYNQETEPIHQYEVTVKNRYQIYQFNLYEEIDCDKISNFILDYKTKNPTPYKSNLQCWQSAWHMHEQEPIITDLCTSINNKVNNYLGSKLEQYYVYESWLAVYYRNDFSLMHNHKIAALAGVYYASVNKNHPKLIFEDNKELSPKSNNFFLFSGQCNHKVPPSLDNAPRIIVGFNMYSLPKIISDKRYTKGTK